MTYDGNVLIDGISRFAPHGDYLVVKKDGYYYIVKENMISKQIEIPQDSLMFDFKVLD